ncbi:FAD-dependent oxidoreductase [Lapidilactobacillus salsurivasis]
MIRVNQKDFRYDVVVVGGGMSGVCAAIAAARNGAKTLIIDQNGYFGGSLTAMGVGPMMTFFAGEKQVIKGIGQEIVSNLVEQNFSPGHVLDTTNYISYVTPFDAEGLKLVLDQMIVAADVDVLFHTYLIDAERTDRQTTTIFISNKDGVRRVVADYYIDATGDADLATASGVNFQLGRESDNASQPMTMNLKVYDVDSAELRHAVLADPERFPRLNRDLDVMRKVPFLSFDGFQEEFNAAKARGEISIPREDVLFFETNNPGEFIMNTTRIIDENGVDARSLTHAEMIGRQQCNELYHFLVKYIPGFEHAKIAFSGPSVGVRGSRQIRGVYTLTGSDVLSSKPFKSTIAHNGYPIDIHNPKGEGTSSVHSKLKTEMTDDHFDRSVMDNYYQIPYEILLPREVDNLLVTGRCVSATFEAQAAIRTTPTMTALGQAAGTAAAQAWHHGQSVQKVDVAVLQDTLISQGSYIEKLTK